MSKQLWAHFNVLSIVLQVTTLRFLLGQITAIIYYQSTAIYLFAYCRSSCLPLCNFVVVVAHELLITKTTTTTETFIL